MMVSPVCMVEVSAKELLGGLVDVDVLPTLQFTGVNSDSREVQPGDLFIALSGLTHHAMDFVPDAIKAGAAAIVYDADDNYARQRIMLLSKQQRTNWIAVPQLQRYTGEIASRFFGHPSRSFKLIGVTGTDGKSSVTHLLVQALKNLGERVGSIGTLGYGLFNELQVTQHTTPDAIRVQQILAEFQQADSEYVVMEVSSHALEQYRVGGCDFDVAVLTNLGSDHLDYHGSLENYAAAKSALFELPGLDSRVLNLDDEFGASLAQQYKNHGVIGYSASGKQDSRAGVSLLSSEVTHAGLKLMVSTPVGDLTIQTHLIGGFNIDNCLACISVLQQLGFPGDRIEVAMQHLSPIPGRMQFLPAGKHDAAVVIDFAHTEQALQACLNSLRGFVTGDLYCVFGCGGDRDAAKRPLMAAAAERCADHVIVTDDNPRHEAPEKIMHDILQGFQQPENVRVIHDRQKAIETALKQANANDLVVIAGKGHEQVQIVGNQRTAFSDLEVVEKLRGKAER